MKLVAVSVVKNEADIIEPFIRHARAWVDHHLVFDHDSTDGTRGILGALQREGLPLTVYTDDALGNLQQARSNALTHRAVQEFAADWILPLDADEAISGPDRATLEDILAGLSEDAPASYLLENYYPTAADDDGEANPLVRLQHCNREPEHTRKILVPRKLAADPGAVAGKGSHAIYRDNAPLADQPLPSEFRLAHFPLRSSSQQAMRVALAELQKLSRGRAHAGLDTHYRLSFQLLAENPDMFFATSRHVLDRLRKVPLVYRGGPLRYTNVDQELSRTIRAFLPFLEKLAASHGELLDRVGAAAIEPAAESAIRPLSQLELTATVFAGRPDAFAGFVPIAGWDRQEGPVAEAYLPIFHWALAPAMTLQIDADAERIARLAIEVLTYSDRQQMTIELNDTPLHQYSFQRVNQREKVSIPLSLRAGANRLVFRFTEFLETAYDARKLAVIFLSLRVV